MQLIKITKNGSLHFKLNDGRIGVCYTSGYVRVSLKYTHNRVYQINKQVFEDKKDPYPRVNRELIPDHIDRIKHLMNFNAKNCK